MMAGAEERIAASPGNTVARVLLLQLATGVVLGMLFWGIGGRTSGFSALLGGMVCVVPNAFLALRLVLPRRDKGAGGLLRAAYIGELGKIALTVILFGLVFTLVRPLDAAALFTGFIAATLMTFLGFLMRDGDDSDHREQDLSVRRDD